MDWSYAQELFDEGDDILLIEQQRHEIVKKERDEFCQQLGNTMSSVMGESLKSTNSQISGQLEMMYLQINQDIFGIVNAALYQNRLIQEESFEKSLEKYFENNRQYMDLALDAASDRIIRAASGPISPRQPNESSLDFYSRLLVYSKHGVQVLPRAPDENTLRYFVRLYAQANSRTPIAPRTNDENFFNYLSRIIVSR